MTISNLSYSYVELAKLLGNEKTNIRSDIWLWLHLAIQKEADLDPDSCNGLTMRSAITSYLRKSNYQPHEIAADKDRYLLPETTLNWITEDERQYRWLANRLETTHESRLLNGLTHLRGRNELIAIIDIWDIYLADKERKIEQLRIEWLRHKATDIDFAWFTDKKESDQRCKCAWAWLENNKRTSFTKSPPISNYNELLMYFDEANLGLNEQKSIIVKIKQSWNKKQFNERTSDKSQYNFRLKVSVAKQLDTLAEKQGLKRAQILETLITREYEATVRLADNT